ncbi:restriction endonuclease subunit R [Nonlabens tegetincola]|uniref:type I restriction enzyme HsdR N-terminal domain-containing protein n=1 Tax=Nonlabens tegetincola TaxID=323273 RepID=UPI000A209939|nr:type I restriction enzyme HsdR N-terminal domain-containing protein [Nonlabens tegetincola]ARN70893.1 restriction endonuclease subunit R [Nonlabens tegetincola]
MIPLHLPAGKFRVKSTEKGRLIFDQVRKKFVVLTPEEWVRQHVVEFLLSRKRIPLNLLTVEKQIRVSGTIKRYDIVSYNKDGSVHLVVECKAPDVKITQETFDQIARYNKELQSEYLMVTNGLDHYFCTMDYETRGYTFIPDIPEYSL